jgi:hypothetical protein
MNKFPYILALGLLCVQASYALPQQRERARDSLIAVANKYPRIANRTSRELPRQNFHQDRFSGYAAHAARRRQRRY